MTQNNKSSIDVYLDIVARMMSLCGIKNRFSRSFIKHKRLFLLYFLFALFCSNLSAAILNEDQTEIVDLALLQDEAITFQSIGLGIALSIAQCDGVELCSLIVDQREIQELINILDTRINSLMLHQEQVQDSVLFKQVMMAYAKERENYVTHLKNLKDIVGTLDQGVELLEEPLEAGSNLFIEAQRDATLLEYLDEDELNLFEDEELVDDELIEELPDLSSELEDTPAS